MPPGDAGWCWPAAPSLTSTARSSGRGTARVPRRTRACNPCRNRLDRHAAHGIDGSVCRLTRGGGSGARFVMLAVLGAGLAGMRRRTDRPDRGQRVAPRRFEPLHVPVEPAAWRQLIVGPNSDRELVATATGVTRGPGSPLVADLRMASALACVAGQEGRRRSCQDCQTEVHEVLRCDMRRSMPILPGSIDHGDTTSRLLRASSSSPVCR